MPASLQILLLLLGGITSVITLRRFVVDSKQEFERAIKKAALYFPPDILKNCERIYRIESAHFKSRQFKETWSPGMESFGSSYPWGWITLSKLLWNNRRDLGPFTVKSFTENQTGKIKKFLVFRSMFGAVMTVCTFLQHYNNNPGRWYSKNLNSQARYNLSLSKINPTIVNNLLSNGEI